MVERHLLENAATGERQEVENFTTDDLPNGFVDRGVVPEDISPGEACWDGSSITSDAQVAANRIAACEASLHARIDREAGLFREKFITSIPGQETTYRLKEDEARSWTSGADPTNFPYLYQESTRKGVTIDDLAATVIAIADLWRALNPKIEGSRVAAKEAVSAASTIEEKKAAAIVDWNALLTP